MWLEPRHDRLYRHSTPPSLVFISSDVSYAAFRCSAGLQPGRYRPKRATLRGSKGEASLSSFFSSRSHPSFVSPFEGLPETVFLRRSAELRQEYPRRSSRRERARTPSRRRVLF